MGIRKDLQPMTTSATTTPDEQQTAPNERLAAFPPLLTINEVASFLRCSKSHVSKILNGKVRGTPPLAAVRLGRRLLVRRETLQEWLLVLDIPVRFR